MKVLFFIIPAVILAAQVSAQNSETAEGYIKKCQTIINTADGKAESFSNLIKNGITGLTKAATNDYSSRCQLASYAGIGYYNQFKFDSAKKYFEQTHDYALKSKRGDNGAYALGALIQIYHYLNENTKSDSAAKLLQPILDTSKNNITKCSGYYALGRYHTNIKSYYNLGLNDFIKSIQFLKPVIDTATSQKFKLQFSITSISIADIYLLLKQPEKALQYLFTANIYAPLSLSTEVGVMSRFVKAYVALKNIDSALYCQKLLNAAAAKSPVAWSELVTSNIALANYYLDKGEPDAAKIFIDTATARAAATTKMLGSQADAINGRYYTIKKNNPVAKQYYEKAVSIMYNVDREAYCDIRKELAIIAVQERNADEAQKQFALYTQANDSLTAEKTSNNLAEMEALYQNKDKQQQIEIKDTQLFFAKKQRFWLTGGLVLAAIAALLLILLYRNKKQSANLISEKNKTLSKLNSELEEANQTKAKLFGIISHDLRSPISQVYQFLKLQQLNPDALNTQQKNELSNKIQNATGSLLETMEDLLLWSKTQMNEFKVNLQQVSVMETVVACQNLLQLNSDAKNIHYNVQVSENHFIKTDNYYLRTIIRNLLQNAIKASLYDTTISITTMQENGNIILSLQNTGTPFSQNQYEELLQNEESNKMLTGLGLKLTQELCDKISASLHFTSIPQQGTLAELTLPIN